ncbi:MAG: hypothetical protein EOM21_15900 [Gammaproteobacteria bacterium]|nr:hypothetical protein [Gammaproteobacteria bacterium]
MIVTREAARELIKSEIALSRGLPSDEFLDDMMVLFKKLGTWQLPGGFKLGFEPAAYAANGIWLDESYELDFA